MNWYKKLLADFELYKVWRIFYFLNVGADFSVIFKGFLFFLLKPTQYENNLHSIKITLHAE